MPGRIVGSKQKANVPGKSVHPKHIEIVRVGVAVGVTLNMGKYESLRLECSIEAEIASDVDFDLARALLTSQCTDQLQRDYDSVGWPLVTR